MTTKDSANNSLHRSDKGLIENIIRFSHLLRDNDIIVSLPAVLDTLAGLPLIDISNLQMFGIIQFQVNEYLVYPP